MVGRLRTTLCLQYKPHYIAAGSMFLAAKLLKVKLPTGKGNPWWMQFDVAPKQLEGMLYIYGFTHIVFAIPCRLKVMKKDLHCRVKIIIKLMSS